jgi:hypothetical protein
MFRKISGLLILGLILASCGVTPVAGGLKDVTATSADGGVSVKWGFDGDKSTIKGFRIYRNAGGDSSSYTKLTDVLNVNATSYSDTVAQGQTYKYGVAVIKSDNSEGPRVNQSGAAVGPKLPTGGSSLTGNWKVIRTNDDPTEPPAVLTMSLDIKDSSGTLSGNAYLFSDGNPFGRGSLLGTIEGTNSASGFALKVVFTSAGFLELTGTVSASTLSGTSVDANEVTGTFTGEKLTE